MSARRPTDCENVLFWGLDASGDAQEYPAVENGAPRKPENCANMLFYGLTQAGAAVAVKIE